MKTLILLALAAAAVVAAVEPRTLDAATTLAGAPAGNYRESRRIEADGSIVTTISNLMTFERLGSKVEMRSNSEWRESPSGTLLSVHTASSSSAQTTEIDARLQGATLAIRTTAGGRAYDRTLDAPQAPLGPEAVRRLLVKRLQKTADSVHYVMFVPDLGAISQFTATLKSRDAQSLDTEQTMSGMPGAVKVRLDAEGWLIRQVLPSPFGDIETSILPTTTQAHAQDSFQKTLAKSNIELPDARRIDHLIVRIRHRKPELGWPDFTAENQRVLEQTRDFTTLEINRSARPAPENLAPYKTPNALLQSDDPQIRDLARDIAGREHDALTIATRLQKWTADHMTFDPGIAIAPASEAVRDRRGTCFAYSMLLGSLVRAAGIPSRIRMGLVYARGDWGGHAWVDIRKGDEWIPLDAALYAPGPSDAARITFFRGSLESGAIEGLGALAQIFGSVDIDILEYTLRGRRVIVTGHTP